MWTSLIIGTLIVLTLEFVLIRSFFMAVKRTIPRIYIVFAFVFFTTEVLYELIQKLLNYQERIEQINSGITYEHSLNEATTNFGRMLRQTVEHEMNVLTIYLLLIGGTLLFSGIFYRNKQLRTDLLNSAGLSLILAPTLYLLRFFWIK